MGETWTNQVQRHESLTKGKVPMSMGLHCLHLLGATIRGYGSGLKIRSDDGGGTDKGGYKTKLEMWGAPQTFGAEGRTWATAHPVRILETGGLRPHGNYLGT